jgi:hypothetical protein
VRPDLRFRAWIRFEHIRLSARIIVIIAGDEQKNSDTVTTRSRELIAKFQMSATWPTSFHATTLVG